MAKKAKITVDIKRANGDIETIDVSKKFGSMNQDRFNQIKKANKAIGNDVLSATWTFTQTNMAELRKAYNDLHNEGGDGYEPENEYFEALPNYKEFEVVKMFD